MRLGLQGRDLLAVIQWHHLDLASRERQIGKTELAQIGVLKGCDRVGAVLLICNNAPLGDLVAGFGAAATKRTTRGDANASRR